MNEDFSKGKSIDSNSIDKELQVRVMNLVVGEASDFERDQLQMLMEQRAEVAAFYQHVEHLHGLLCEFGAGEPSLDIDEESADDTWQLSPERRQRVLAVLNGKDGNAPAKVALASSTITKQKFLRSRWWSAGVVAIAASVLLCLLLLPSVQSARSVARRYNLEAAGSAKSILDFSAAKPPATNASMNTWSAESGSPTVYYSQPSGFAQPSGPPAATGASSVLYGAGSRPDGKDDYARFAVPADEEMQGLNKEFFDGVDGRRERYRIRANSQLSGDDVSRTDAASGPADRNWSKKADGFDFEDRIDSKSTAGTRSLSTDLDPTLNRSSLGIAVPAFGTFDVAVDNFSSQDRFGKAAIVPATPNESRFDDGLLGRLSASVEFPKPDIAAWKLDSKWIDPGGVDKNSIDASVSSMMTVTPRIIIAEEEARREKAGFELQKELGENTYFYRQDRLADGESHTKSEPQIAQQPAGDLEGVGAVKSKLQDRTPQSVEDASKRDWYENSPGLRHRFADEVTAKNAPFGESKQYLEASKDIAPDVVMLGDDFIYEARVKDSNSDGIPAAEGFAGRLETRLGWERTPAPSPEVESKKRGGIALQSKPAAPQPAESLDEQTASAEAHSTFSLHVSDVSFKVAQALLSQGQWPEAAKIRIEEFVNALDYHDPLPGGDQKVACRVEQAIHPFLMQRNLLRVSMRTAATGRAQNTPLRLTLLLDNSGSMERPDRRQAVLRAFQTLTNQLSAADQVTLISFASTPRLLAEKVPGNQGETLLQLIENLPSEGGTNLEAALLLAREKAAEQQLAGAQSRIVLLTDGAVNLGNANPESLAKLVIQLRDAGIAFDAAGISAQDLNDEVLEALTRQGDGRYYLLDSAEAATESFAAQVAGALSPSAQNVKVQVEFNPQRVGRYKLLGFEKHRLAKEDFRNDQVDAAEMAAAEAGVAVYQFEVKPNGSGDVGSVSVRFRDLSTGQMVERRWPIPYESNAPRLEQAEATMQLAASAALFAAKLSGGPIADSVDLAQLQKLLATLSEQYANQPRVQQLKAMIDQAKEIGK